MTASVRDQLRHPASFVAFRIGWLCEWLDERIPHQPWTYRIPGRRLICSAADTSYGWNPEARDWEERATWLDRWIDAEREKWRRAQR